ncbi:MAG: helix-turn-helix transcriptional regulator [Clostridia bacterium]|nr:helix-turn-helix transcriptional regulator [Clostridia bacterium]
MRLRDIREDNDLTQKALADYLHIRQNTYSQYENVQRQLPVDVLIRLAAFYHTSTDYLLGLTDEPTPYPLAKRKTEPPA